MLFSRGCSGARIVKPGVKQTIGPNSFVGYGSHTNAYPVAYITIASAIGGKIDEMDSFLTRLDKCMTKFKAQMTTKLATEKIQEKSTKNKEQEDKSQEKVEKPHRTKTEQNHNEGQNKTKKKDSRQPAVVQTLGPETTQEAKDATNAEPPSERTTPENNDGL